MPQNFPLNVYRGDCYHWSFTFWSDLAGTVAYDLAGAVAKAEIRAKPGSAVLAALGCVVTLPNTIVVSLSSVLSESLSGKSAWDLQVTFPDGCVKTLVAGGVSVTSDITDSVSA